MGIVVGRQEFPAAKKEKDQLKLGAGAKFSNYFWKRFSSKNQRKVDVSQSKLGELLTSACRLNPEKDFRKMLQLADRLTEKGLWGPKKASNNAWEVAFSAFYLLSENDGTGLARQTSKKMVGMLIERGHFYFAGKTLGQHDPENYVCYVLEDGGLNGRLGTYMNGSKAVLAQNRWAIASFVKEYVEARALEEKKAEGEKKAAAAAEMNRKNSRKSRQEFVPCRLSIYENGKKAGAMNFSIYPGQSLADALSHKDRKFVQILADMRSGATIYSFYANEKFQQNADGKEFKFKRTVAFWNMSIKYSATAPKGWVEIDPVNDRFSPLPPLVSRMSDTILIRGAGA